MTGEVSEWLDLMPSTVTISTSASLNRYGVPTYGAARSARARITVSHEQVIDAQGNAVISHTTIWVASTAAIAPTDKVTLPDGRTPPILRVERQSDEAGWHHTKVYLGA